MGQVQPGLVGAIELELSRIDQEIASLTEYRASLSQTIELHKRARGIVVPISAPKYQPEPIQKEIGAVLAEPAPASAPEPPPQTVDEEEPVSLLTDGPAPKDSAPNTLDMTRTVLRNAGTTMSLLDIRAAIKQTYGIDPAKTLDQMLYKRAAKNKGFYKTEDGLFGLSENRPIITPIAVPMTAIA